MAAKKKGIGGIIFPLLILIAVIGIIVSVTSEETPDLQNNYPRPTYTTTNRYTSPSLPTVGTKTSAEPEETGTTATPTLPTSPAVTQPTTQKTTVPTTQATKPSQQSQTQTALGNLPAHRRMYQTLNAAEKAIYTGLRQTLIDGKLVHTFSNVDVKAYGDGVNRAVEALYADFPEFFWINGGWYCQTRDNMFGHYVKVELTCYDYWTYTSNKQSYIDKVFKAANDLTTKAAKQPTTYGKIKYVHDYLITNVAYNHGALERILNGNVPASDQQSHTLYGALINKTPVCDGYSKTFQLIMNNLGIECEYYEGETDGDFNNGVNHAWNYLKLDGKYYWMDVTWDDLDYADYPQGIAYEYFCITTDWLDNTHVPYYMFNAPSCTADAYSYFTVEQAYVHQYSFEAFCNAVKGQEGQQIVNVRFSSTAQLKAAIKDLFENRNYNKIPYFGKISGQYGYNEDTCILRLYYK